MAQGCAADCSTNRLYGLYAAVFDAVRAGSVFPGGEDDARCGCQLERSAVALARSDAERRLPKRSGAHFARLIVGTVEAA